MFVQLSEIKLTPQKCLWEHRIPCGAVTAMDGDPQKGKTTLIGDLANRLSKGSAMPGQKTEGRLGNTLWLSAEDDPQTIRANLLACGANLERIFIFDRQADGQLILPQGIKILAKAIDQHNAAMVILDPFSSFIAGSTNSEKSVRAALDPLADIARQSGAAIIIVRHLNKAGQGGAMHRALGSIAASAAIRSGLLIGSEPGVLATQNKRRVLAQHKNNLGPLAESLSFTLASNAGGVVVDWPGASSYSADQLLTHMRPHESHALDDACAELYQILQCGREPADGVLRIATLNGVTSKTLRRAKSALEIESVREGWGPGSRCYWQLPKEPNDRLQRLIGELTASDETADKNQATEPT